MRKYLIISDVHLCSDELEDSAYTLVKKVAMKEKFDVVVNLGDMVDMEYLSSFVEGMPGVIEGSRLADDFEVFEKELLFWKKYSKESIFCLGNHELRLDKFLDKNPVLKGALSTPKAICEKTKTEFVSLAKQPYKLLKDLYVSHGISLSKYCFAQNAERAGMSVITGHSHRGGTYMYRYPDGRVINGTSIGTLGPLNPAYITSSGRIAGWVQSFAILYVDGDDWQFDHILIKDGKSCIVAGKAYSVASD